MISATRQGGGLALGVVLSLALAAPAGASAEATVDATPGEAAAEQALEAAEQALSGDPGEEMTPDPSVALLELATSYSELEGSERRRARALLARPDDGLADWSGVLCANAILAASSRIDVP